ncbi:hypothetical protein TWF694_001011 [Orbilia ellipsospora]|uniref:Extracellular serine-rich protein n=1 Tax=Orbilia ellipsospora TaxID=2528407 RepID=A0AAV9XS80_9PEZI
MASNPATTPPPASSVIRLPPLETPSGIATTMIHIVTVGKKPDKFDPEIVMANAGDKLCTYERPCIPYDMQSPRVDENGAIWSNWAPVSTIKLDDEMPSFTWTVRSADQLFLYCGAPGSCNKAGMVMIVNPDGSVPFELYRQAALAAPFVLVPGERFPSDEIHDATSFSTTAADFSPPSPTLSASNSNSSASPNNQDLATIAGIIIGGIGATMLIGLLIFFTFRRQRHRSIPPTLDSFYHDSSYTPRMQLGSGAKSTINPYFQGTTGADNPSSYASELPPISPIIQPHRFSVHTPNGTGGVQTRETVIIPLTEEERAIYLGRLHGAQSALSSGGVSPVSTTGGGMVAQAQLQRLANMESPYESPTLASRHNINKRNVSGTPQLGEYGTRHRPAEMAACRFEEDKGGLDEEITVVYPMDTNVEEKYGQVYPI